MKTPKHLWAVMTAKSWSSVTFLGMSLSAPDEGPDHFIPVFRTKKRATAWMKEYAPGEEVRRLEVNS